MQKPLQIVFRDIDPSPSLEGAIRRKFDKLEHRYPRLTSARVVVEVPHRGAGSGKTALALSVEISVPNRAPIIVRETEERRDAKGDQGAIVGRAFEAVSRQLDELHAVVSGVPKAHASAGTMGMIAGLFRDQGYGFVEVDGVGELHFTRAAVADGAFDRLATGEMVHVVVAAGEGPMGPQAGSVRRVDAARAPV